MNGIPRHMVLLHPDRRERTRLAGLLHTRYGECRSYPTWPVRHADAGAPAMSVLVSAAQSLESSEGSDLKVVHRRAPDCAVIVLVEAGDAEGVRAWFRAGAKDCLPEPVSSESLFECVDRWVNHHREPRSQTANLDHDPMHGMREQVRTTCLESTRALVAAVEAKDPHTRAHSQSVARYAEWIGRRWGLSPGQLAPLRDAALLHDVGKIGIPDAILTKPGPLTPDERRIVERHPEAALDILGHMTHLGEARPMILHHHERYDGMGYPARLAGEAIPLGARIIAIADAIDAMLSPRSYKPEYDWSRVRAEIQKGRGTQFDPQFSNVVLDSFPDKGLAESPGA